MRYTSFLIAGLFILGFSFSTCNNDANVIDTVASPVAPAVARLKVAETYYNKKVQLKTNLFYGANEFKRAWLGKKRPNKLYRAFVADVKASADYGLSPSDYHIADLEEAVEMLYDDRKRTGTDVSNLDIRITASFFLYTTHLTEGRIRYPGARKFFWKRGLTLENDIALLLKMESASDLRKEMEDLHPKDPQYKALVQALKHYRKIQQADTLPPVSTTLTLKPGETHNDVPAIRAKLKLTDYKGGVPNNAIVYDEAMEGAVKKFQQRHGLEPDGIVGGETIRQLNTPLKKKIELISLNLERLRWLPHLTGTKDEILINVPAYMLYVYRNGKEKMQMRVVLGAEYTPTPVFHDTLKYIVFSPTWMVPRSIFVKEFLPKLQEDAGHFETERFRFMKNGKEIDPEEEDWEDKKFDTTAYSVIENPGDANALGKVKFIMPNDFSIYLHDTPADRFFSRDERAMSHGCIRLEEPQAFAAYLLADQKDWNEKKITKAMNSGEPTKVDLQKPYPVYIVYRTAWVDDDSLINFRSDIYGHDGRHLAYLKKD